jgi:hypothetical protein
MHTSLILLVLFPTVAFCPIITLISFHKMQCHSRGMTVAPYTTSPNMIYFTHTHYLDEIRLDHIHRGRRLYTRSKQNIHSCKRVLEKAQYHIILVSRHGGFLLVNLVYSRILLIFWWWQWQRSYLNWCVGLMMLHSNRIPEDGTLCRNMQEVIHIMKLHCMTCVLSHFIECICQLMYWI